MDIVQMNRPLINTLGSDWRSLTNEERRDDSKFLTDRVRILEGKHGMVHTKIPEYMTGNHTVLDFSCGNGAFLEVMRYYKNDVMGVDIQNFKFMESQGIPYIRHDCGIIPYPFSDNSYDLVTCMGSISAYRFEIWKPILSEFFRIARKCVFIIANSGKPFDRNRDLLDELYLDGWTKEVCGTSYKWSCYD